MASPELTPEALEQRFLYHAPKGDQAERYAAVRSGCLDLAKLIVSKAPPSRELSRALNSLDEVMFLTNAAIARNE